MKIGVIGDDFTGSGDVANTLARAGARTLLYVGTPKPRAADDVEAAVIALKTRSAAPVDAVAQSRAACRWLREQGAEQILFKYCSTFDSTPQGNIGPVAAALLDDLEAPLALVCPAFPANGRTVYQGHLFVRDRLLSESGMEKHPLTPMTDPDIRRWLARQTQVEVGHLALAALRRDPQAALATLAAEGPRLIVADAIEDEDLFRLGRLARGHRLVTGGSGIAMGLPANFGIEAQRTAFFAGVEGPAIVLSGSCSAATLAQVDRYRSTHPALQLEAEQALSPEQTLAQVAAFLDRHRNAGPLVFSSASPEAVRAAQARFGRERLASAYDRLFAEIAAAAVRDGFTRIVAAGGETSGAVAEALGGNALDIGPEIATGVPALATRGEQRLGVALKSGNFGGETFFAEAAAMLATGSP